MERHADLARVATLDVQLVLEVRRLVAEVETADRIFAVEHVAPPEHRRPARRLVAELQVREHVGVRLRVVGRHVEVELVERGQADASGPASRVMPARVERGLIFRRMRLLAIRQHRAALIVVLITRAQEAERAVHLPLLGELPAQARFEAVVVTA